jgi:hypothetical protein
MDPIYPYLLSIDPSIAPEQIHAFLLRTLAVAGNFMFHPSDSTAPPEDRLCLLQIIIRLHRCGT